MRFESRNFAYMAALAQLGLTNAETRSLSRVLDIAVDHLKSHGANPIGAYRIVEQMVFALHDTVVEDGIKPRDEVLAAIVGYTDTLLKFGDASLDTCVRPERLEAIMREYQLVRPADLAVTAAPQCEAVPA